MCRRRRADSYLLPPSIGAGLDGGNEVFVNCLIVAEPEPSRPRASPQCEASARDPQSVGCRAGCWCGGRVWLPPADVQNRQSGPLRLLSRQDAQKAAAINRRLGLFLGSLQRDSAAAAAGAGLTTSINPVLPSAGRAIMATITTSTIGEHVLGYLAIFRAHRGCRKRVRRSASAHDCRLSKYFACSQASLASARSAS